MSLLLHSYYQQWAYMLPCYADAVLTRCADVLCLFLQACAGDDVAQAAGKAGG